LNANLDVEQVESIRKSAVGEYRVKCKLDGNGYYNPGWYDGRIVVYDHDCDGWMRKGKSLDNNNSSGNTNDGGGVRMRRRADGRVFVLHFDEGLHTSIKFIPVAFH
jgi:hypothetical protein